jgi:hypothetical protein
MTVLKDHLTTAAKAVKCVATQLPESPRASQSVYFCTSSAKAQNRASHDSYTCNQHGINSDAFFTHGSGHDL